MPESCAGRLEAFDELLARAVETAWRGDREAAKGFQEEARQALLDLLEAGPVSRAELVTSLSHTPAPAVGREGKPLPTPLNEFMRQLELVRRSEREGRPREAALHLELALQSILDHLDSRLVRAFPPTLYLRAVELRRFLYERQ